MTNALTEVKPFVYTSPQGLKLEVLFVLDPEKKGYINATAIATIFDKQVAHWLRTDHVAGYIEELVRYMNQNRYANSHSETKSVTYDDLVIVVNGGPIGAYGTWLHPKLAVIFARWISPHFAIWCDELITKLLQQYPVQQQQSADLAIIVSMLKENQQQFEQRFVQKFDQHVNQVAEILNNFHDRHLQEAKLSLGQIYGSINKIHKLLQQQQHHDLLQPPVQETLKAMLLDYQQVLKQMLQNYQDELIQGYLVKIEEALAQIMQRVPQVTVNNPAITTPVTSVTTDTVELAAEIAQLRTDGNSWHTIANILNERGIFTTSGKGKWHGSSVKRYLESHAAG